MSDTSLLFVWFPYAVIVPSSKRHTSPSRCFLATSEWSLTLQVWQRRRFGSVTIRMCTGDRHSLFGHWYPARVPENAFDLCPTSRDKVVQNCRHPPAVTFEMVNGCNLVRHCFVHKHQIFVALDVLAQVAQDKQQVARVLHDLRQVPGSIGAVCNRGIVP